MSFNRRIRSGQSRGFRERSTWHQFVRDSVRGAKEHRFQLKTGDPVTSAQGRQSISPRSAGALRTAAFHRLPLRPWRRQIQFRMPQNEPDQLQSRVSADSDNPTLIFMLTTPEFFPVLSGRPAVSHQDENRVIAATVPNTSAIPPHPTRRHGMGVPGKS